MYKSQHAIFALLALNTEQLTCTQLPWQEGHNGVSHIRNNQILTSLHQKMMSHPSGIFVDIVGIEIGDHGCSHEEYEICDSVLKNDMVVCLQKVLLFVIVDHDCLAYCNQCHLNMVVMLNFFVIMLSLIFCFFLMLLHKNMMSHSVLRNDGHLLGKGAVCCFC